MSENTGGPAFPLHNHGAQTLGLQVTGMTLRDYFAAKAMQAILARPDGRFTTDLAYVTGKSYQYADAMLKEREQ